MTRQTSPRNFFLRGKNLLKTVSPVKQINKFDNVWSMGITSGFQTGQHAIQQEYAELGLGGGINVGRTTTDDESQPFIAPIIGKKGIAAADIFITPSSVEAEENLSLILAGGEASVGVTRRIPTEK